MKLVLSKNECNMLIEAVRTHIEALDHAARTDEARGEANWTSIAEKCNKFDELREKLYTARGDEE